MGLLIIILGQIIHDRIFLNQEIKPGNHEQVYGNWEQVHHPPELIIFVCLQS
jgi:hypothetical protein